MSELNYYNLYSYSAQDFKSATDDKILVDLKRLDTIEKYDEVLDFIKYNFGEVGSEKILDYSNDVKVNLQKFNNLVIIYAEQKEERIFGKCWRKLQED